MMNASKAVLKNAFSINKILQIQIFTCKRCIFAIICTMFVRAFCDFSFLELLVYKQFIKHLTHSVRASLC